MSYYEKNTTIQIIKNNILSIFSSRNESESLSTPRKSPNGRRPKVISKSKFKKKHEEEKKMKVDFDDLSRIVDPGSISRLDEDVLPKLLPNDKSNTFTRSNARVLDNDSSSIVSPCPFSNNEEMGFRHANNIWPTNEDKEISSDHNNIPLKHFRIQMLKDEL